MIQVTHDEGLASLLDRLADRLHVKRLERDEVNHLQSSSSSSSHTNVSAGTFGGGQDASISSWGDMLGKASLRAGVQSWQC